MFPAEKKIPYDSKAYDSQAFGHTNITLANFHYSLYWSLFTFTIHLYYSLRIVP